jgi:hypothetical protein
MGLPLFGQGTVHGHYGSQGCVEILLH